MSMKKQKLILEKEQETETENLELEDEDNFETPEEKEQFQQNLIQNKTTPEIKQNGI
jgi:hypothetical protein